MSIWQCMQVIFHGNEKKCICDNDFVSIKNAQKNHQLINKSARKVCDKSNLI